MATHTHHSKHHKRLDHDLERWRQAGTGRKGVDRLVRRERAKTAIWNLIAHLRCCHVWLEHKPLATYEELKIIHDEYHNRLEGELSDEA
jgi:hypothetical protein